MYLHTKSLKILYKQPERYTFATTMLLYSFINN